jgi:2-polyprenyl-6-methoxyphenol hydroxylase-like FAD-dependent oxidoreductase
MGTVIALRKTKVLIVGAGPAGTSAAIVFARLGWDVTILDRRKGIDQKICGECLSPPSFALLESLGALSRISASEIRFLDGITLVGPRGAD